MLCSDGLYGMVSEDRIAAVLGTKPPNESADILVDMANAAGGGDNVTVIVAHILSTDALPTELWEGGDDVATIIPRTIKVHTAQRFARHALLTLASPFKAALWLARKLRAVRR